MKSNGTSIFTLAMGMVTSIENEIAEVFVATPYEMARVFGVGVAHGKPLLTISQAVHALDMDTKVECVDTKEE